MHLCKYKYKYNGSPGKPAKRKICNMQLNLNFISQWYPELTQKISKMEQKPESTRSASAFSTQFTGSSESVVLLGKSPWKCLTRHQCNGLALPLTSFHSFGQIRFAIQTNTFENFDKYQHLIPKSPWKCLLVINGSAAPLSSFLSCSA